MTINANQWISEDKLSLFGVLIPCGVHFSKKKKKTQFLPHGRRKAFSV